MWGLGFSFQLQWGHVVAIGDVCGMVQVQEVSERGSLSWEVDVSACSTNTTVDAGAGNESKPPERQAGERPTTEPLLR